MNLNKLLLLSMIPFAFVACDDESSPNGSTSQDDNNSSSSVEASAEVGSSSSVDMEWVLPNDPSNLWTGSGTDAAPYVVSSEGDLEMLAEEVNNKGVNFNGVVFQLASDITLSKKWTPIGCVKGQSNRTFGGTFDGNGKTIKNLSIDDTASIAGLFGYISGGVVKNLKLEGVDMKSGSYSGMLFGKAEKSTIVDCSVSGKIAGGDFVGGLGGSISSNTSVENVSVSGSVQGNGSIGGIVATMISSTVKKANNDASVSGKVTVGGITSTLSMNASLELCVNKGAVSGTQDVAGVVAKASQTEVKQSGNEGVVTAEDNTLSSVGGVVAIASNKAVMSQVYNTGKIAAVNAIAVGGVVGKLVTESSVTNAFNQGEVVAEGNTLVGGIAGKAEVCVMKGIYNAGLVAKIANAESIAGSKMSTSEMTSVFYDATVQVTSEDAGVAVENMKTAEFLAELNTVENVWTSAADKYAGFPYFAWMN